MYLLGWAAMCFSWKIGLRYELEKDRCCVMFLYFNRWFTKQISKVYNGGTLCQDLVWRHLSELMPSWSFNFLLMYALCKALPPPQRCIYNLLIQMCCEDGLFCIQDGAVMSERRKQVGRQSLLIFLKVALMSLCSQRVPACVFVECSLYCN